MHNSWVSRTLQGKRWLMEKRLEAVEQNDVSQLLELLSYQCQPSPKELTSALETAVLKKSDHYARCVEVLLVHGANPSGTNGCGSPFLLLVADAGCEALVRLLLEANCDINQSRDDGTTALHRVCWCNQVKIVQMLLDAGADPNVVDIHGRTPLMLASQGSNVEVMVKLFNSDAKCDPNIGDNIGRTPIYWATCDGNIEAMVLLVEAGSNVNSQDRDGCTPLMLASSMGNIAAVEFLLLKGAEANLCDTDGDCALLLAAEGRHVDCVRALVGGGADVNTKNQDLATALLYLIDFPDVVADLLVAGASANVVTEQGITPLWIATYNDRAGCVKLLLKANCDPTQKAGFEEKKLPLQVALYDGSLAIVQLLFLATLAWGGDLKWLDTYLKDSTYLLNCQHYPHVLQCKEWIEAELKDTEQVLRGNTLLNISRRRVRQCLGEGDIQDKIRSLPLPASVKDYVDLRELDSVEYKDAPVDVGEDWE